ncbi:MAG: ion channel [Bacteroidota bacterium]
MIRTLYEHRFEVFLGTQILILFGSLFVPLDFFEQILLPILFLFNIGSGILLISRKRGLMWFFIALFLISAVSFGGGMFSREAGPYIQIRLTVYFVFHIIVTLEIIKQVWRARLVNKTVIIGLMSGYISLGFLAFFLFLSIELWEPNSFRGILMDNATFDTRADNLMYYAYITLLTIGYGEIVPVTQVAQKAAILVGLTGQFYLVIITAVVVEKYIRHSTE